MEIITTTLQLEKSLKPFAQAPFITVDTEFHRQSTYYPELCLIQAACPSAELLIDPLAPDISLTSFFTLMQNPNIIKVFHAARQDIEIFFLLNGKIPTPLFDTQIAASVCGYGDSPSYDTLVAKITGIQLDKSSRFTDWRQRPLSAKQLDYALADVTHLRDIYSALDKQLRETKRNQWLKEEMAILTAPETYKLPPEQAWKRLKTAKNKLRKPQQWAALQKLAAWREQTAQTKNLPRGYILADDSLMEIALQLPQNKQALTSMRALRRPTRLPLDIDAILKTLAEAKKAVENNQLPQCIVYHSVSESYKSEVEILKLLLKILSDQHNVAAKVIANSEDLGKIARDGIKADVPAMHNWRFELFGRSAIAMLEGKLAMKFEKGVPQLFTL